jgi:hypothetical protein
LVITTLGKETSDPAQKLGSVSHVNALAARSQDLEPALPSLGRMQVIDARDRRFDSGHVAGPH